MSEFNNLKERLELIVVAHRELHKAIKKNNEVCYGKSLGEGRGTKAVKLLVNKTTKKNISILRKKLGLKDSLDAETWVGCFPIVTSLTDVKIVACTGDSIEIALKVMPITITDLENKGDTRFRPWREVYVLEKTTEIIQNRGVPSLPILYGFSICNSLKTKDYINKRLIDRMERSNPAEKFGKNALIIFSELADYDLEYWVKNILFELPDANILKAAIFQVMSGLLALNQELHLVHFDLHVGNVLVSEISAGGYFHYKIGNSNYYVPNYGYLFKVWDFSRSVLLESDTKDLLIKKTLFHGKRYFGDAFKKKTANVVFNIEEGIIGTFMDYLYSFDTFKFAKTLYTAIRIKQEADTTSRTKKKRTKPKPDVKLDKSLNLLVQIIKSAQTDLLKKLTLSKKPKKFVYSGTPREVLLKFFSEYKKKPDASLIINKDKPFVLR